MSDIFTAVVAGAFAGAIMLFLSHVAPKFARGSFIRDVDRPTLFGRSVTRREAHFIGLFLHLTLSAVFAGIYAFLVQEAVVPGYGFVPLLLWGLALAIFIGLVIMPLEGHGLFGLKEDAWFPVDLCLTNALWAMIFWWLMRIWIVTAT